MSTKMASDAEAVGLTAADMNSLDINDKKENGFDEDKSEGVDDIAAFPQEELYKLALHFFKEKDGTKAMALTYKDKLRLVALTRQVSYGKYRPDVTPQVGFLDVVGNDRRSDPSVWLAWQSLGDISREEAMSEFTKQLDVVCPLFKPYLQAHHADKEEQERRRQEDEEKQKREELEVERQKVEEEMKLTQEQQKSKQMQQEMQIREALNQQTAIQFRQYAEQQFPGNTQQQDVLIRQLQEQHFHQYMQQVYQQQLLHQQQQFQQLQAMAAAGNTSAQQQLQQHLQQQQLLKQQGVTTNGLDSVEHQSATLVGSSVPAEQTQLPGLPASSLTAITANMQDNADNVTPDNTTVTSTVTDANQLLVESLQANHVSTDDQDEDTEQNLPPPIAAPSMWTRKDLKEFKDSLRKDTDSVIKVGSGETVTVRVPTHEDGTCLFWEFATDSYDIGFGVYFEWTIAPSNQVSVHVSESSDEEDLEDEEGGASPEGGGDHGDVEKGGEKKDNRPPTDEIIPVYRRDCHEEVYCGSHMYPGRGVYLLKFDNSYSLWRSKTLYYRVYYTR